MAKKRELTRREKRNLRLQQIAFLAVSVIILLAMIFSLVTNV